MHDLRKPCVTCDGKSGRIETKNGQDCVYCKRCGRYQYNAPRSETGRAVRTVQTTHENITPKKRVRILNRASGRCELCGKGENLHVGHIVSVNIGHDMGMSDSEINDDENLVALCDECNLGLGDEPLPLRVAVSIVMARINYRGGEL